MHKIFPRVRLRRMDFLNIPARTTNPYATARHSHPCSLRAFRDIHVPKLLKLERNIKKISFSCTGRLRECFVHYAIYGFTKAPFDTRIRIVKCRALWPGIFHFPFSNRSRYPGAFFISNLLLNISYSASGSLSAIFSSTFVL